MERKKIRRKNKMMSEMRDLVAEDGLVAGEDIAGRGMADAAVAPPGQERMKMENIQVVIAQERNENRERREGKISVRDHLAVAGVALVQGNLQCSLLYRLRYQQLNCKISCHSSVTNLYPATDQESSNFSTSCQKLYNSNSTIQFASFECSLKYSFLTV